MKIVVTGATGFVGRQLVPELVRAGATLLLVARDPVAASRLFEGVAVCGHEELARAGAGFDVLVHLAVLNNDARASEDEFGRVNVGLLLETLERARQAGIARFLNVSSVHALDPRNRTAYARTKREAAERLKAMEPAVPLVTTLYLPVVHGDRYGGKLAFLDRLPRAPARWLFGVLSALRPTLDVRKLARFVLEGPAGREVVLSDGQERNRVYLVARRGMDMVFCVAVLALFWWLLALIALLVRLDSSGPAIFAQRRVGLKGREFTLYKFRTMRLGTPQTATHEAPEQSVTRLGRFLRRTKLDELPQVWNVLRNEIGLVGPRPCLPSQAALVAARLRRGVLGVKPGITGLAQVNGIDMRDPERLAEWDARYVALRSILLDVGILIATAFGRGRGDAIERR